MLIARRWKSSTIRASTSGLLWACTTSVLSIDPRIEPSRTLPVSDFPSYSHRKMQSRNFRNLQSSVFSLYTTHQSSVAHTSTHDYHRNSTYCAQRNGSSRDMSLRTQFHLRPRI
jgi:hypothetical protein